MSGYFERARIAAAVEVQGDFDTVVALDLVGDADKRVEQLGQIDWRGLLPLQLGIEPAGVGNIRNQPIEPLHVVLNDAEKPPAALLGARHRQCLHRRTHRCERIFEFVRHVCGKALDRFDPAVERVSHVAQRAGQVPDLVAPAGEIRNFNPRSDAAAHAFGSVGKPPHRLGDRSGQEDRKHDHHCGGDEEDLENGKPLGLDHVVDVGALGREHERAAYRAEALHRHCH